MNDEPITVILAKIDNWEYLTKDEAKALAAELERLRAENTDLHALVDSLYGTLNYERGVRDGLYSDDVPMAR